MKDPDSTTRALTAQAWMVACALFDDDGTRESYGVTQFRLVDTDYIEGIRAGWDHMARVIISAVAVLPSPAEMVTDPTKGEL